MSVEKNNSNILIVICGPTAVGKTAVSVDLAETFRSEIISTDSRQFYREMNAATAKPALHELHRIKHHFINSRSIHEEYSAGMFEQDASKLLETLFSSLKLVFAVGGSGLYVKALTEGLDDFPDVDSAITDSLSLHFQQHGIGELQKELQEKDPEYYNQTDVHNPRRVLRALGVIRQTGLPFSSFHGNEKQKKSFNIVYLRLGLPREELYQRINLRVNSFLELGLIEEAISLFPFRHLKALQTVGYSEMFDHIEGKYSLDEALDKIRQHSRNYAKRQETWLKKYVGGPVFRPDDAKGIQEYLKEQISNLQ
jgi:tRNA dimethylallyltransferase